MANASVDKLKALGIRHGEKAVVGLTATLFVVFVVLAIMNPVLDMEPEQLKSTTTNAQSNLQTKQAEPDILAKLEKDGLKEPNFQKIIDGQIANALKPDGYRARLEWVTPEPGAGLIRDQPELIAPVELTAFPGRGGILLYSLDSKGERIIDEGDAKKKGGGRPGAGLMGPGGPGGPGGGDSGKKLTAEEKKAAELAEEKRRAAFAGNVDKAPDKEKAQDPAEPAAPQGPFKEEVKGKRWVVITATLDNAKLKKNYLLALKNEAIAYPNFKRVDVERQVRQSDGSWSDWTPTDKDKNYEVLDNLPEYDTEFVPENQRPSNLVDPLPFLRAGYWTGVHVAKLVPAAIRDKSKDAPGPGGNMMGPGGPGGGNSRQNGPGGMLKGGPAGPGGGSSLMNGPGGMAGPGGPGGNVGGGEEVNFTKYDEETVMIRSLDFTVDGDQTYRFRLRLVVHNPNWNRTDVNPGVDVENKSLFGPWSEPSPSVTVPADVVAYALAPEDANRRNDLVTFQVVRWDPGKGQTVIKPDSRGPGEIIGEYGSVPMPDSDGNGSKSQPIDFNSRSIVLDTFGGRQKMPDIGVPRNLFDVPAMAMIVEPDGNVVVRSQAIDNTDEVREDMEANYKQALKDSDQKRGKSSGARSGGKRKRGGGGSRGGSRGGMPPGGGSSRQNGPGA